MFVQDFNDFIDFKVSVISEQAELQELYKTFENSPFTSTPHNLIEDTKKVLKKGAELLKEIDNRKVILTQKDLMEINMIHKFIKCEHDAPKRKIQQKIIDKRMGEIFDDINYISLLVERVQREFDIAPSVDDIIIADQEASQLTQFIGELYKKVDRLEEVDAL